MREKLKDIQFWLFLIWMGSALGACQSNDMIKELREIRQEIRNDNAQ